MSTGALTTTSGSANDLLIVGASVGARIRPPLSACPSRFRRGDADGFDSRRADNGAASGPRSGDLKTSPAGTSTSFAVSPTPASVGWRGQIAAFTSNASTTTLTASSPTPLITGSTTTLTATIDPSIATRTVNFKDNAVTITGCAAKPVSSGIATCTTPVFVHRVHPFPATYTSDTVYDTSNSNSLAYTVTNAATTDCFRSNVASGNWNVAGNWQEAKNPGTCPTDNAAWVTASTAPTSAATGIEIRNGHTITVSAAATGDFITVDNGGDLEVSASVNLTLASNSTDDLKVTNGGTLGVAGTITMGASGSTHVQSGGTINVSAGGTITGAGGNGGTRAVFTEDSGGTVNDAGSITGSLFSGNFNGAASVTGSGSISGGNSSVLSFGGSLVTDVTTIAPVGGIALGGGTGSSLTVASGGDALADRQRDVHVRHEREQLHCRQWRHAQARAVDGHRRHHGVRAPERGFDRDRVDRRHHLDAATGNVRKRRARGPSTWAPTTPTAGPRRRSPETGSRRQSTASR